MNIASDSEYEADYASEKLFHIDASVKPRRHPFKFKDNENGNVLSLHHTVREHGKLIRVPIRICAFSELQNKQLVAIDKRGNIFVFQLSSKRYFRHKLVVPKACALKASVHSASKFLIGTKNGKLLYMDVEQPGAVKAIGISNNPIVEISFPGQPLQPSQLILVNTGNEAILIDIDKFTATHRLDFDQVRTSLKFACFLPHSEQIFTCFTNDALHIWSGVTLNTLNIVQPIKARDRQIRLTGVKSIPSVALPANGGLASPSSGCHLADLNYSDGQIVWYCCKPDGSLLCLCTLDSYVLLLSPYTFRMSSMFRLEAFVLRECAFMPHAKETLLLGLTTAGQVVLIDAAKAAVTVMVETAQGRHIQVSGDGKLLAVLTSKGEAHIWSTAQLFNRVKSQEKCMELLREACSDREKAMAVSSIPECLTDDIKQHLKRDRLLAILKEFGTYPAKYRVLIWSALLQLPYNRTEFQLLLSQKPLPVIRQRVAKFRLKNEALKRSLLKVWNCLAHWCKVLAHAEFVPNFVFPFIKCLPKNSALIVFEVCVSLFLNHCQLWFEFHPLAPSNYLGICNNILQHFDPQLSKFYASANIQTGADDFAFAVLSNGFSEVLDEEQWLQLWDHVLSTPPDFIVFFAVAFNILQREVIMRLPDKSAIQYYFREQQPIDMAKLLAKAYALSAECPEALHPRRYMSDQYQPIPKGVYPKFLNYPKQLLSRYEVDVQKLQEEHRSIDQRLQQLELEEHKTMQQLEERLKSEEHAKRIKEMESLYHDTVRREEERVACQRKLLLLYQKKVRQQKAVVLGAQVASERRTQTCEAENELATLMQGIERQRLRTDVGMLLAEDEQRHQNFDLYAQRQLSAAANQRPNFTAKFKEDVTKLCREGRLLDKSLMEGMDNPLPGTKGLSVTCLEKQFAELQQELFNLCKLNP